MQMFVTRAVYSNLKTPIARKCPSDVDVRCFLSLHTVSRLSDVKESKQVNRLSIGVNGSESLRFSNANVHTSIAVFESLGLKHFVVAIMCTKNVT